MGTLPFTWTMPVSTLVPKQVIATLLENNHSEYPSCGEEEEAITGLLKEVTDRIEGNSERGIKGARQSIAEFITDPVQRRDHFSLNTTHAINTVALGYHFKPGDVVLVTDREHNSNLLPWLRLQKAGLIKINQSMLNGIEEFDLEFFESHFKGNPVRLVSMAYTSDVTGATLPAR